MGKRKAESLRVCPPKPALNERPLLTVSQSNTLEAIFKVLGNGTRLRLLHSLVRKPAMSVTELSESVNMKPQAVSNQLQRLLDRSILASRRNGNQIHYSVVDPCVIALLDQGLCLSEEARRNGK